MKNRANVIACALVLGAFVAPAAQAADRRSPGSGNQAAPAARASVFANLGVEGSGRVAHKSSVQHNAQAAYSVFANLGVEGSGLTTARLPAPPRPWAN